MVGILVLSHGHLANELVSAMEHVAGPQNGVRAVSVFPGDDINGKREEIAQVISDLDSGKGVLVLADMFGGTPYNLVVPSHNAGSVEIVSGVNLPMLVKSVHDRPRCSLVELVKSTTKAGGGGIFSASDVLDSAMAIKMTGR